MTYLTNAAEAKGLYRLSGGLGALLGLVCLIGLLLPGLVYPSQELQEAYRATDASSLLTLLPALALVLAGRGRLLGLLLWPGALLAILYNYLAYLFGMPFSVFSLSSLTIVGLSGYLLWAAVKQIDHAEVAEKLRGLAPRGLTVAVLLLFGLAFLFLAVEVFSGTEGSPALPDIGVAIADIVLSVIWVAGGLLLAWRRPLGYSAGMGLLYTAMVLFLGLIVLFFLRPLLTSLPFDMEEMVVILAMTALCALPFGLYWRAVIHVRKRRSRARKAA